MHDRRLIAETEESFATETDTIGSQSAIGLRSTCVISAICAFRGSTFDVSMGSEMFTLANVWRKHVDQGKRISKLELASKLVAASILRSGRDEFSAGGNRDNTASSLIEAA